MATEEPAAPGYRPALRHPVVRSLYLAAAVSVVGDYIAQGALLFLAYERTGGLLIGPAGILAAAGLPAMLSGALTGGWLDRLPRDRTLAGLAVAGGLVVLLPLILPGVAIVFVTAGLLGAVRAATTSVRSAAMAEGVPDVHRGPLLGLLGATEQSSQVLGYVTGAALFATLGAATALVLDAATFGVGAVILARLHLERPAPRERRPPLRAGLRDIRGNPVLRILMPLAAVTAAVGAIPETMASGVAPEGDAWRPIVLAAAPLGQAVTTAVVGRTRHLTRPSFQLVHLAWLALAFGIAALSRGPGWVALANLLVGSGIAWLIGPQLAFVRLAPAARMAQVTGTMIALLIAAEGAGSLVLAAVADSTSVATAYRVAGVVVLVAAVLGWVVKERTPLAHELDTGFGTGA